LPKGERKGGSFAANNGKALAAHAGRIWLWLAMPLLYLLNIPFKEPGTRGQGHNDACRDIGNWRASIDNKPQGYNDACKGGQSALLSDQPLG